MRDIAPVASFDLSKTYEFVKETFGGSATSFGPALNVNTLGEVPDSSWFTNRLGRHDLSMAQVLRGPVIRVDAAQREPGRADDGLRDRHRRRARRDAAAIRADIDLDQYGDADPCGARRSPDAGDGGNVVGQHGHGGLLRHRGEPRELRSADDLVCDEHVAHAGGDERFRLADLLAADADGAALELRERDLRALVRLAVRTQRDSSPVHCVGHQVEVALERVEVDDEGGRVYGVDRIAGPGGRRLHDADRNPRTGLGASAGKPAPAKPMDAS